MSKVRYRLSDIPPLSTKEKAELQALARRPDSEIDLSDIPPLPDDAWKNAVRGRFYKPTKTPTTVRVDTDVLYWLKRQGRGYQTRINTILREAMLHEFEQLQGLETGKPKKARPQVRSRSIRQAA